MAGKTGCEKKQTKRAKPHRAPAGRGGSAMGRTVGLPFGGVAARKTKTKSKDKPK